MVVVEDWWSGGSGLVVVVVVVESFQSINCTRVDKKSIRKWLSRRHFVTPTWTSGPDMDFRRDVLTLGHVLNWISNRRSYW